MPPRAVIAFLFVVTLRVGNGNTEWLFCQLSSDPDKLLDYLYFSKKATMLVGLILGFTILGLLWYFMTRLPPSYPPTPPIRLPILGHFHYFLWIRDSESNSALYKMFKRYSKNDVLTLHIGTERMTMIGKTSDNIYDISKIYIL